jgi:hypothetical protein
MRGIQYPQALVATGSCAFADDDSRPSERSFHEIDRPRHPVQQFVRPDARPAIGLANMAFDLDGEKQDLQGRIKTQDQKDGGNRRDNVNQERRLQPRRANGRTFRQPPMPVKLTRFVDAFKP